MRERVIKTIFDYWEGNHPGADWDDAEWDHGKLSDAILAALPSMVQDLVWDKHPDEQEWYCHLPETEDCIERGYMVLPSRGGFSLFEGFTHRKMCLGHFTLATEARADAGKRNVSQAMATFGIEVET